MATPFTGSIDQVVALFRSVFEHAAVLRRDERAAVTVLEIRGDYGAYRVHLQDVSRGGPMAPGNMPTTFCYPQRSSRASTMLPILGPCD